MIYFNTYNESQVSILLSWLQSPSAVILQSKKIKSVTVSIVQCKEVEENNRMGKTRELFKKIKDTKGNFHAKMGIIKDKNCMDLTETEDIKKRWQEYTEELYEKDLHDPDNHDGVITHLEPDILECEVQWTLGSITVNNASGGNGILLSYFKITQSK